MIAQRALESIAAPSAHRGWNCMVGAMPGGPEPSVSVVVAAYNEEEHIAGLLTSLRAQTHPVHEVLVADDGSRDRTARIAEGMGAHVFRLRHRGPQRRATPLRVPPAGGRWYFSMAIWPAPRGS